MDLHREAFGSETIQKLDLYRDYVREWLPVFLRKDAWVKNIQIFDFFAGPGHDEDGVPGSPLITLEELEDYWEIARKYGVQISLFLNEYDKKKYQLLLEATEPIRCEHPELDLVIENLDFADAFKKWSPLMSGKTTPALAFLDQNGVKHITPEVFNTIVHAPKTDSLFFISSSYFRRFNQSECFKRYIDIPTRELLRRPYAEIHRIILDFFKDLVPDNHEYYLASFSFKKGANIYGLIFGTGHPRGIDKFLSSSWKKYPQTGDANFDIDRDGIISGQTSLFPEDNIPTKLKEFERELRKRILSKELRTNIDVYLFALESGCLAKHAKEMIKRMCKEKLIRNGTLNISYDAWKKWKCEKSQPKKIELA